MDTMYTSSQTASRRSHLLVFLASACVLTACQKSEVVPTTAERLKSIEQKQETQPDFYLPRKTVDYMSDLKSLKDTAPKPAPPAPSAPATTKPPEAKPTVAENRAVAPPVTTPVAPPVRAPTAPAVPAANVVASAVPTARPTPPNEVAATLTVLSREQPEFPRNAIRAGVESGSVRAKLVINAAGGVSTVVIVEANPSRVFDRSVTDALLRWKFNPGAEGRTYETQINFKL